MLEILKTHAALLVALLVFTEGMTQYFLWISSEMVGLDAMRALGALGGFLVSLMIPLTLILIVPTTLLRRFQQRFTLQKSSLPSFGDLIVKHTWPLTLEGFRFLGQWLLRVLIVLFALIPCYFLYPKISEFSLLHFSDFGLATKDQLTIGIFGLIAIPFLIPSVISYLRLQLFALPVVMNPDYEKGNLDALRESQIVTEGYKLKMFGILLVSSLLTGFLQLYNSTHSYGQSPLPMAISAITNLAAYVFLNSFMTLFYIRRRLNTFQPL